MGTVFAGRFYGRQENAADLLESRRNESIEAEELVTGFADLARKKGFLYCLAQNTNPDNILRILNKISERFPVDRKRVYIGGFSQGATQAIAAVTHYPEIFAGVFTSGVDIYRPWDNFDEKYTAEEFAALKEKHIPMLQVTGQDEPFWYAPLNEWKPITWNTAAPKCRPGAQDSFVHPGRDNNADPTRIYDTSKGKTEKMLDTGKPQKWRMCSMYEPSPEENASEWMIRTVNKRLELLDCEPRDVEKCLSYQKPDADEFHRVVGCYGEEERTEDYMGLKKYTLTICDRKDMPAYRFIVLSGSTHFPQIFLAEEVCGMFGL